jgi:hypothetical protein
MALHLDTSLAPHNFGRGMTVTARTPVLTTNVYANVMGLSPRRYDQGSGQSGLGASERLRDSAAIAFVL